MDEPNKKSLLKRFNPYEMGIYAVFLCLIIVISILSKGVFLKLQNITNVLRQTVWVGIMTFGAVFVFSLGGIDLSVGSTYGAVGLCVAYMLTGGVPVWTAILLGILIGAAIGFINGLLIYKLQIAPFIATMAVMTITRGFMNVATRGVPVSGVNMPGFTVLGQGYLGAIPIPVVIAAVVLVLAFYVMNWTKFGRYCLSIGSNTEAARLVGINVHKIGMLAYVLTGAACAISGILVTGRLEGAMPTAGEGYELDVIAAAVIGGTSLNGGKASVIGSLMGALLMAVVRNGMNLVRVSTYWHNVVMGAIIIIAVIIDRLSRNRDKKRLAA